MAKASRSLAAVLAVTIMMLSQQLRAQNQDENWRFMLELNEITNNIDEDTAKESAQKCIAMGEKLKTIDGMSAPQRLYFEYQIEHCQFQAMNNGDYSDSTGDQCSHHFAATQKLAAAIDGALSVPGTEGEFMAELASQLDRAMNIGPQMECKGDYTAFAKTLSAATASGQKEPKQPDFAFMEEITGVTGAITAKTAKADIEKCKALSAKFQQKTDLFPFEQRYYPALIENCFAIAVEKGATSGEQGGECAHLYRHGALILEALAEAKRQPGMFDAFPDMLREDLKSTATRAGENGCKEDFAGLKEQ